MAAGQSPGKLAVCSLVRPITVRVPDGVRQATADPVLTTVQGYENRPAICRCRKISIWQNSAKNMAVTAGFIKLMTSPYQTCMFQLRDVTPTPLQGRGLGFMGQPNPLTRNGGNIWVIQMFTLIFLLFSAERNPQKYTFAFSPHALSAKYCPSGFSLLCKTPLG